MNLSVQMSTPQLMSAGFPSVRLPSRSGGLPVEVCLLAQLGIGAGDRLFADACRHQRSHPRYIDALDEPSAKLLGINLAQDDATSVYTFAVDRQGHPFHRHAGHRVFTAISGSGGAQLRFSTASSAQIERDPSAFFDALHHIDIPADSLFTVRFGGETWHQFAPPRRDRRHPVFFAISCHTDELGGIHDPAQRAAIARDEASIPDLTELLPASVQALLAHTPIEARAVPTTTLMLQAAPRSLAARGCARIRRIAGALRTAMASPGAARAFIAHRPAARTAALHGVPSDSLLATQLDDGFDHEDMFALDLRDPALHGRDAADLLADVLEGFLVNRPTGVSWLMQLRNLLVRPLRLRTSPLGCPVSSLLSPQAGSTFAGRYPVLAQSNRQDRRHAQVVLGADDRHLRFRSCVAVRIGDDGSLRISLGTRVQCRNRFGRFYMAAIERVHRHYVAPRMLDLAVAHALAQPAHAGNAQLTA